MMAEEHNTEVVFRSGGGGVGSGGSSGGGGYSLTVEVSQQYVFPVYCPVHVHMRPKCIRAVFCKLAEANIKKVIYLHAVLTIPAVLVGIFLPLAGVRFSGQEVVSLVCSFMSCMCVLVVLSNANTKILLFLFKRFYWWFSVLQGIIGSTLLLWIGGVPLYLRILLTMLPFFHCLLTLNVDALEATPIKRSYLMPIHIPTVIFQVVMAGLSAASIGDWSNELVLHNFFGKEEPINLRNYSQTGMVNLSLLSLRAVMQIWGRNCVFLDLPVRVFQRKTKQVVAVTAGSAPGTPHSAASGSDGCIPEKPAG
eukprot:TRINITY_DN34536_c0_g1_i1.p1 TRINITY_DN34536_c0_g1~~TRINITY_DN34536_c0_g1_i1.p1  ORF type:complete len:308 (-),score=30.26 TRINITY_DN34536_c0_g1_i1:33-956(-)